jgi:hypothetical protein
MKSVEQISRDVAQIVLSPLYVSPLFGVLVQIFFESTKPEVEEVMIQFVWWALR